MVSTYSSFSLQLQQQFSRKGSLIPYRHQNFKGRFQQCNCSTQGRVCNGLDLKSSGSEQRMQVLQNVELVPYEALELKTKLMRVLGYKFDDEDDGSLFCTPEDLYFLSFFDATALVQISFNNGHWEQNASLVVKPGGLPALELAQQVWHTQGKIMKIQRRGGGQEMYRLRCKNATVFRERLLPYLVRRFPHIRLKQSKIVALCIVVGMRVYGVLKYGNESQQIIRVIKKFSQFGRETDEWYQQYNSALLHMVECFQTPKSSADIAKDLVNIAQKFEIYEAYRLKVDGQDTQAKSGAMEVFPKTSSQALQNQIPSMPTPYPLTSPSLHGLLDGLSVLTYPFHQQSAKNTNMAWSIKIQCSWEQRHILQGIRPQLGFKQDIQKAISSDQLQYAYLQTSSATEFLRVLRYSFVSRGNYPFVRQAQFDKVLLLFNQQNHKEHNTKLPKEVISKMKRSVYALDPTMRTYL